MTLIVFLLGPMGGFVGEFPVVASVMVLVVGAVGLMLTPDLLAVAWIASGLVNVAIYSSKKKAAPKPPPAT